MLVSFDERVTNLLMSILCLEQEIQKGQMCFNFYAIGYTVFILISAHALISAHPSFWYPKLYLEDIKYRNFLSIWSILIIKPPLESS